MKTKKELGIDTVWLAVINHRHGHNIYLAKTEHSLRKQVYEYVKENWESEGVPGPVPRSYSAAIDDYFLYMGDTGLEEYLETFDHFDVV